MHSCTFRPCSVRRRCRRTAHTDIETWACARLASACMRRVCISKSSACTVIRDSNILNSISLWLWKCSLDRKHPIVFRFKTKLWRHQINARKIHERRTTHSCTHESRLLTFSVLQHTLITIDETCLAGARAQPNCHFLWGLVFLTSWCRTMSVDYLLYTLVDFWHPAPNLIYKSFSLFTIETALSPIIFS